ncbi:MAG: hypothetical protein NT001_03950 [Candidatus Woesearchaeota archaeon]|nr:hypothetical protein [Candidatus Woesearchaeota archaeon]
MVEIKTIEEYRKLGTIKDLPPNEKENYLSFLEITHKDNVKASEFMLVKFPRWSIIAGYYAMHDVSKLYLAKKYGLKLSQPMVHSAVIQALRELVKRKDILGLLEKAEKEYDEIISLHLAMLKGKDEREKSQYYTSVSAKPSVSLEKASYFLERLVKPYLKLMEELMK